MEKRDILERQNAEKIADGLRCKDIDDLGLVLRCTRAIDSEEPMSAVDGRNNSGGRSSPPLHRSDQR